MRNPKSIDWFAGPNLPACTAGSEHFHVACIQQAGGRIVLGFLVALVASLFAAPLRAQVTSNDTNFTPAVLNSALASPQGVVFRTRTSDLLVSQSGQISIVNATTGTTNSFATQASPDKVDVRASDGLVAVLTSPSGPIVFYNSSGNPQGTLDAGTAIATLTDMSAPLCLSGSVFDTSGNLFVAAGPESEGTCEASTEWAIYEFAGPNPWTSTPTTVTGFAGTILIQDMAYSAARPPAGTLYAVDSSFDNVYEIVLPACPDCESSTTRIAIVSRETYGDLRGVAVDPLLGDIYVTTQGEGGTVQRIPAPGCIECDPTPVVFANGFLVPELLDFDTTGNLYVNDSNTGDLWKFARASNATALQAVTQGQANFLNFTNPNPTMTDQRQSIMIPSSANLGGTAFIQDIFVSVDPTTLDATLANGTPGDVPFFGGAPVPPGTTCVLITSANNNCVVVIQKCYDANHNPFAICPVQEPSSSTDLIQLTFSYQALLAPTNGAFLIGFDDGDGQDITDITSFPFDCCTGGGSGRSLCSKTFAASLPSGSGDFSLSVSPNPVDLTVSNPAPATVNVASTNGFNSTVTLGVSDALAGISATFTPTSLTPPNTSTLNVDLSGNTTIGGMAALVANLVASGCVDNSGVANALTSKLSAAQSDISAGQIKTAINVLTALNDQVRAQAGKHIATTCTTTFPMLVTGTATPFVLPETRSTPVEVKFGPVTLLATDIQTILTSLKASVSSEDPITGFVVNSSGVGVSGVTVNLVNSASITIATATTDATGFYFFATTGTLTVGQNYTIQVTGATPPSQGFTWTGKGFADNFTLN